MTRKIISLCLIAAMLLTMMPLSAFAAGDATPYLEDTLPTDWTNQHKDFTITAKDGVTAMSVNGTAVEMIGGSIGGGVISEGGKPYVKYKVLGYDKENTDVIHIGAFIGNIKSGKGHGSSLFTFKYDKANWAPYDINHGRELTAITRQHSIGNCAVKPFTFDDYYIDYDYPEDNVNTYNLTEEQAEKCVDITLEVSESGAMFDFSTGVVAATWYTNIDEIDATEYEVPILRFALIKKGNGAVTANTLTQPLTTELTSEIFTAGLFDKTVTSSNQIDDSVAGIVYTTGNNNLDYVVQALDGTRYGCAPSVPGTLKFEGNTANADAFKVEVTVNGTPYTKTYNVKYDDVKPTIEVKPEQSADPVQKVTYNVTAEDDKSGVKAICVNGTWHDGNSYTVDVEESGTHTFEFKAIDNAGNESDVVTRTVTIDNEGPELNVTGNPADWTKEDVVLTINAETGATVTVNGSAVNGTTYTVTENGTYTFVATDAAGNTTTKTVVVNKIDKVALSFEYELSTTEWTKEDITVTINATAGASGVAKIEVGKNEISGNTFNVSQNGTYKVKVTNGVGDIAESNVVITNIDKTKPTVRIDVTPVAPVKEYTFKINATDGESGIDKILVNDVEIKGYEYVVNESKSGFYSYSFKVIDKAGNVAKDNKGLNIDLDPPKLTIEGIPTAPTKDDVVLTIKTEDGATVTVNGEAIDGTTYTVTKNGTYTFVVTDKAGNDTTKAVEIKNIDKTAPSVEITGNAVDWTKENVVLNVKATDNLSKDNKIEITLNDKPFTGETLEVEENGKYTFVATDEAGNKTTETVEVKMIDKVVPSIKVSGNEGEWTNEDVVITIDVTVGESGVKSIEVEGGVIEGNTFTVSKDGTYKVKVTSVAGNSVEKNVVVADRIDKIAPTLEVSKEPTKKVKEHTFTFEADDDKSGLEKVTVSKDGGAEEIVDSEYTVNEAGTYVFTAYDVAGNTTEVTRTIPEGVIDNEAPVIEIQNAPEGWLKDEYTLNVTVDENATVVIYKDGEEVKTITGTTITYTVTESGEYKFVATDEAENVSEEAKCVISIDRDAPAVSYDKAFLNQWIASGYVVELDISDEGGSEIASVTVNGAEIDYDGGYEFEVTENIDYVVVVTDNAGNIETVTVSVKIDDKTPVISEISKLPPDWVKNFVLSFKANDDEMGIDYVEIIKDDEVVSNEYSYKVERNGTYKIKAYDKAGNFAESEDLVIEWIDDTAPEIVEPIEVPSEKCKEYTLKIYVTEEQSGVAKVTVGNEEATFNGDAWECVIDEIGPHYVKATDKVGRESAVVSVIAENIDNDKPRFENSNYDEISKNWTNEDFVSLQFTISKEIKTLTVTIDNGAPVELPAEQDVTYNVEKNGKYIFTATDEVGNVGTYTVSFANIDNDMPTIKVSGKPEGYVNEPYNVTVDATDATSDVTVTVSKDNGEPIVVSGKTYRIEEEGEYTFIATDVAGNTAEDVLYVDNIDKEAPGVEFAPSTTAPAKEFELTINYSDNKEDKENIEITVNGKPLTSNVITVTDNIEYVVKVKDTAGNENTYTYKVKNIDKVGPTVTFDNAAPEAWTNSFILGITATDEKSEVATIKVMKGDEVVATFDGGAASYDVPGNDTYKVIATDALGNESEAKEIKVEKLDKDKPELTVSGAPAEWVKDEFTFDLTYSDALSGIKEITVNGEPLTSNVITVTENETYVFVAYDNAGNKFEFDPIVVDKIDETAPEFEGVIEQTGKTETSVTVSLPTAKDDSGIKKYELFLDGVAYEYDGVAGTYTFDNLSIATTYKVKLVATDMVDRETAIEIDVATSGLGKIEVSVDLSEIGGTADKMKLEAWNGEEKMVYTVVEGKLVFEGLTEGTYTIDFKAPGFFPIAKAEIVVVNGETTAVTVTKNEIIAGDSTKDNKINIFDLNAVASAFAESYDGEAGLKYDFNRDGKIDIDDVKVLVKNYKKVVITE